MAEQTFKSPGFFEREIEVISRPLTRNTNTPVGVIGPAQKGQAFVPKTVTSVDEFIKEFGMPDQDTSAAHAIAEYFNNAGSGRGAATFCRILGTGSSSANGDVSFAGFKLSSADLTSQQASGAVQFIVAEHNVDNAEHITYGIFNDNDSISTGGDSDPSDASGVPSNNDDKIQLVRAMIFMHKDYTMTLSSNNSDDRASTDGNALFTIYIQKASDRSLYKSYEVSLDPAEPQYIAKVLNTDSFSFSDKKHFLYADFPVDSSIAKVEASQSDNIAVVRGKDDAFMDHYGDFRARFEAPQTTSFISQPFGKREYSLFHFESLDDGSYASGKYKLSIADLKASTEKNNKYGTFTVQLRDLRDTDEAPIIFESYTNCSLDPNAKNFIGRLIGDQKVSLSLDVDSDDEKRLVREGTFPNKSTRIRVVLSDELVRGEVPENALPFGFRGIPALRTTPDGKDGHNTGAVVPLVTGRQVVVNGQDDQLGSSVLPPLPLRFKVTKGSLQNSSNQYFQTYLGQSKEGNQKTSLENVKTSLYWGLHTSKVLDVKKPNDSSTKDFNPLVENLTKFLAKSSSVKFSNVDADLFNNNKFSLAKVAFPQFHVSDIKGTVLDAFLEAVYVRNAELSTFYDSVTHRINMTDSHIHFTSEDEASLSEISAANVVIGKQYIVTTVDGVSEDSLTQVGAKENVAGHVFIATADTTESGHAGRVKLFRDERATMAKLLAEDPVKFNKYSLMAKFTAPFYGGFDGTNILDRDDNFFTDRSSSIDVGGHAASGGYVSGLATSGGSPMQGVELQNNAVLSYRNAVRVMTDEMVVDHNVLVIPGIRESLITDFAARRVKEYGKAIYLMDIPHYDSSSNRIFVSSRGIASGVADVDITSSIFDVRELDSSYVATYFPDVMIADSGDDETARLTNQRSVRAPSSVVALGALAASDRLTLAPWFAPAGFARGSLNSVTSLDIRLNAADRDTLYEARINPIANFPNNQFVIFGQKTTQIARTALDRVNVRRLMINIKRRIQRIAQGLLFEQNDAATRNRFVTRTSSVLADIRVRQGIEDFRVIMDETNNTSEDVDNNRLNGRIIVVPTRAVEFIAMDFVITNSGVEFPS